MCLWALDKGMTVKDTHVENAYLINLPLLFGVTDVEGFGPENLAKLH